MIRWEQAARRSGIRHAEAGLITLELFQLGLASGDLARITALQEC